MRTEIASVGDPGYFGTGPDADLDLRIRTCDMRISEAQKHTVRIGSVFRNRNTSTFTYITVFFKDKIINKISYKTVEIKVYPLFLLDDGRIRSRIRTCDLTDADADPGGAKTYGFSTLEIVILTIFLGFVIFL
jgi:hypothetical protein